MLLKCIEGVWHSNIPNVTLLQCNTKNSVTCALQKKQHERAGQMRIGKDKAR